MTALAFTPLEFETRPTVSTAAAAHYLHLRPQTLRIYACKECGPLRPIRISKRLHWSTDEIRALLGLTGARAQQNTPAITGSPGLRTDHRCT
jgi:hypothetical protein